MHHFIYPSKDTYITNRNGLDEKNFGITEILRIGTQNIPVEVLSPTTDYVYIDEIFNHQSVEYFTGTFTGALTGIAIFSVGSITGSNVVFNTNNFTGTINGTPVSNFSGSISGSTVSGSISGSISGSLGQFAGQLTGSSACLYGTGSGIDTRPQSQWISTTNQYVDRSLLQFNLMAISGGLAEGSIVNPKFSIKLKVCNEYNLPITYTIYALPISQSWNMGDGYMSDNGSDTGVSWKYKDNNYGTAWFLPTASTSIKPAIDFINNPTQATASFRYGGGTWYSSNICSQSFEYMSSDIDMDVTSIVMAWISGSIPNNGLILISSDELQATGSGYSLTFYSKDTNTIYSPYLDVMWDDITLAGGFITGSILTGSVVITTSLAGITASVQSGSSLTIAGGVSGSFSSSVVMYETIHYITASNQTFDYTAPGDTLTNAVWYANNGYHYDSWWSSWDLDPYSGGFLPNTDIQLTITPAYGSAPIYDFSGSFTGSFSGSAFTSGIISGHGQFTASYFSGSINGINQEVNNSTISGSVTGNMSGSITTNGFIGIYTGILTSSVAYLNGTGSGTYLDTVFNSFTGFVDGHGLSGNVNGIPIFGAVTGFVSVSQSLVTGSCGNNFSASLAKALLTSGVFSGSSFTAFYVDHKFENGLISGSWTDSALLGAKVTIPLPSAIEPYAYAYVNGTYINGKALGLYSVSGSTSASFNGQFVDGNLLGANINLQLSGSTLTSSYSYTSSVELSSSVFTALDVARPFTVVLQNMSPVYKAGDIIKIGVFGRKQFPLKYFGKSTQQEQYIIPEYLPTSSYYALKDNETDEIVIDFDSYTQIGCTYPYGNYFMIDTTGLPQDRYYRILIRVNDGQSIYTIDEGKTFKLTR